MESASIMKKRCAICGNEYQASPTDKKATCGQPACVSARKKQTHTGKHNHWSPDARVRASARGKTSNLKLGTPAAQQSPLSGPFETNQEAKWWWIISPDGDRYHIRNLRKFCRDHPDLFTPDPWQNAYAGMRQVQASLMGRTKRSVGQWKGWRLAHPAEQVEG